MAGANGKGLPRVSLILSENGNTVHLGDAKEEGSVLALVLVPHEQTKDSDVLAFVSIKYSNCRYRTHRALQSEVH